MGKGRRKGWKKEEIKRAEMSKSKKLTLGNSLNWCALIVGVFLMIIIPPLALKLLGLGFVCFGVVRLLWNSYWTHQWSHRRKIVVACLMVGMVFTISVPQFITQWRNEHHVNAVAKQSPKLAGLSMRIGGFITTGIEHDSTRIQVTIIASNDGDPTGAGDWNMKITTSNGTIQSRYAFGEPLANRSLNIPRLDVALQQPIGITRGMPGYVSFIVPHVAQRVIDDLYKDMNATIIVSARDSNNREVRAESSLHELWSERHVRYSSK